jgi:hypothetical protein
MKGWIARTSSVADSRDGDLGTISTASVRATAAMLGPSRNKGKINSSSQET